MIAAGAVMNYLRETQKANLLHIRRIRPYDVGDHIVLDPSTKRNLEITSSMPGSRDGNPLRRAGPDAHAHGRAAPEAMDQQPAEQRRDRSAAAWMRWRNSSRTAPLLARPPPILGRIGDLERLNTRICTGRATPREMIALKSMRCIGGRRARGHPERRHARPWPEVRDELHLSPELSSFSTAGSNRIPRRARRRRCHPDGYNAELDELRTLAFSGKQWIADLQKKERERTGISSLKVGFNNVFGYYIEITNTHREKIPADYIRKQTLTNAERYITPELKEYEEKILHAEERILALETRALQRHPAGGRRRS